MSFPDQIYFSGDYFSWSEAARECPSPDFNPMLDNVLAAMEQVRTGKAVAQRDGIVLDKVSYNFPLVCSLLSAATKGGNHLSVLDFGGSLGIVYFDARSFLRDVSDIAWSIVELPHFVAAGKKHLANEELKFYETIEDCVQNHSPNIILLSGVLQYLPNPWETLLKLLHTQASFAFIDRTALIEADSDRLTIQHIPKRMNGIDKPAWFLSESKFLTSLKDAGYERLCDFPALDKYTLPGAQISFKGFIFRRRTADVSP